MLALKALSSEVLHGYAIGQRIAQFNDTVLRVEEGSLYPALYRMESEGLIASEWGVSDTKRRVRYYRITRKGRLRLQDDEQHWREFIKAISKVIAPVPARSRP